MKSFPFYLPFYSFLFSTIIPSFIGIVCDFFGLMHTSEIRGFCLMKWPSSETLQNLLFFIYLNTKAQSGFFHFLFVLLYFLGFRILYKIYQILKHFAGSFHQVWTSYFWRVCIVQLFIEKCKKKYHVITIKSFFITKLDSFKNGLIIFSHVLTSI